MRIGGVFNGTGADVYLNIGFRPDMVRLWNLEGAGIIEVIWNKGMQRASEVVEGVAYTVADRQAAALTKGNGLLTFIGGTILASADVGTTTYGEGVYLKPDYFDYRQVNNNSIGVVGDAATVAIDKWTLGSASNYTGNFNSDVVGTYLGEGSPINIDGKVYTIVSLSSAAGGGANEVTLSHNVPDGVIYSIHGMFDYKPMVAGESTKDGFLLSNTDINTNDEMVAFEAVKYDV